MVQTIGGILVQVVVGLGGHGHSELIGSSQLLHDEEQEEDSEDPQEEDSDDSEDPQDEEEEDSSQSQGHDDDEDEEEGHSSGHSQSQQVELLLDEDEPHLQWRAGQSSQIPSL